MENTEQILKHLDEEAKEIGMYLEDIISYLGKLAKKYPKYDRQAEKDKFFRLEDEEEYEEAAKVAKRYFKYLMDEGCTDLDTGDLLIANSAGFHEGFAMALENE